MGNCFCTIITSDYFSYAQVMYCSLKTYDPNAILNILVVDESLLLLKSDVDQQGLHVIPVRKLMDYPMIKNLYNRYAYVNTNFFRWSLKPVFMSYLLENGFDKVCYVDWDIHFYNDYRFLFDELEHSSILLTPHWYTKEPFTDDKSFVQLLTKGVFNAGFIGSNKKGIPALQWWANACHFKMGNHEDIQIFDDQKYLDFLPSLFENVKILKHKGCNLGSMNKQECKREMLNNKVLINGKYPIIFIHFGKSLVKEIEMGFDPLLAPYLTQYKEAIKQVGISAESMPEYLSRYSNPSLLQKLKWKTRIRTRLKRLLYKIVQSI